MGVYIRSAAFSIEGLLCHFVGDGMDLSLCRWCCEFLLGLLELKKFCV